VGASAKLRWRRMVNELRFVHDELKFVREISQESGREFESHYREFCLRKDVDLEQLNRQHAERVHAAFSPQAAEEGLPALPEHSGSNALVVHQELHSPEPEIETNEYQMSQDELEIHETFHKIFRKLAWILHPDKLETELSAEERKEKLTLFKEAKEAFDKRHYFVLLDLAERFKISIPRNYSQQIRWMKKEIQQINEQLTAEKRTYNYAFSECETEEEKDGIARNFFRQLFGICIN
jgi:hypothetical protein